MDSALWTTMRHRYKFWIGLGLTILWLGPFLLITRTNIVQYFTLSEHHVVNLTPKPVIPLPSANPRIPSLVTSPTGVKTSLLERSDHVIVPNIVHYVWFGEYEPLKFHHFLSIRSAYRFIKPEKILFHCDHRPTGKWWDTALHSVPSLEIVKHKPPTEIFGNEVILAEHKSDIARMEILMKHGGIYLDTDVIVLKSFTPLRRYRYTMGLEYHGNPGRLNNGVIIATKDAEFLRLWYDTYRDFTKREWDYHDSAVPYKLQYEYPKLIHVEEKTLNWPSGRNLSLIYDQLYDWKDNYAMHLWYRLHELEHNPHDIREMNTTFGEISRLVYYGSPEIPK